MDAVSTRVKEMALDVTGKAQGLLQNIHRELSERMGFVLEADHDVLREQLAAAKKDLAELRRRVSGRGRDSLAALRKQVEELRRDFGRLQSLVRGTNKEQVATAD